jgi:hypothetical protein
VRLLLGSARTELSRLKHLWLDAGYEGRGKRWVEEVLGVSVEVVRKPPKPTPEKVAKIWAQEWAKEGEEVTGRGSYRSEAFSGVAEEVGGGTHFCVPLSEQADEQGL